MVRLACPMASLRSLFAFLECALNAGAQPFRTRPIESACTNGHNGEHVAHQLFGRLLDLGLIEDWKRGPVATQTPGRDS